MNLDLSKDHRITLKRHGKKLWSYQDNKPDVVEAAVLDYLRDHGFDGYFTERDAYLSLFMSLAGWSGKIGKRMPPGFGNPHRVYYMGSDGWLRSHKYTFAQAMSEAENTTIEKLAEKLRSFCLGKTYSLDSFSNLNQQPEHMIGFLRAFGIERLQKDIKSHFSEEALSAMKFLYNFDTEMLYHYYQWRSDGQQQGADRVTIFNCAFHRGGGFEANIDHAEDLASHVTDSRTKEKILDACALARRWREKTLASYDFATLDLQLWDEIGTAIVEVKAPNDRLGPSQKNTIERARKEGERACVIYVSEAN